MTSTLRPLLASLAFALAAAMAGAACDRPGPAPTAAKVPPSLDQPPATKTAMWSMAHASGTLSELLQKSATPTADDVAQARRLIDEIAKTVDGLAADPASQAHPILGPGLPGFRDEVAAAKAGLMKDPPDAEPARRLGASCRQCHAVAALTTTATDKLARN